jgi:hypothetical protein
VHPGRREKRGGAFVWDLAQVDDQRLDFRANKSKVFARWKLTGFFEVVNLLNRDNYRFDTFNGYNSRTGGASPTFDKMFPILPSAGLAAEF